MTANYRTSLPASIMKLELIDKHWNFPISRAIACTRVVEKDDDGKKKVTYVTRPRNEKLQELFRVSGLPIVPGLMMVTGATGTGKTQATIDLAEALSETLTVAWITLNEPALLSDSMNTDEDVADALFAADVLPDVIVIDSFRLLQFSVAGTTRSGGVSSGLFEMLTELNNAAEQHGVLVVGLFNPLASDADAAARFDSEIESSVQTVVKLTSRSTATVVSRATGRQRENVNLSNSTVTADTSKGTLAVSISAKPTPSPLATLNALYTN